MVLLPRLMAIPEPTLGLDPEAFARWVDQVVAWGADSLQVRCKSASDRQLYGLARRAVAQCRDAKPAVQVLVNGRADIAAAAEAAGVHLPSGWRPSMPDEAATREPLPLEPLPLLRARFPHLLFGLSVHSVDEARQVAATPTPGGDCCVDYLVLSPIWASPGKGPALGPASLAAATRIRVAASNAASNADGETSGDTERRLPILALGGVDGPAEIEAAARAGAHGVAAIRAFATETTARHFVAAGQAHFRQGVDGWPS